MFKKAQLKFFLIIISILLVVFTAILGSINIIMKVVMESQSRTVLKQIAAGVEYDDATSTFTYVHPDFDVPDHNKHIGEPPPVPKEESSEKTTEPTGSATKQPVEENTTAEPSTADPRNTTDQPANNSGQNQNPPPDTTVRTAAPTTENNAVTTTSAMTEYPTSTTFPPEQFPPNHGWQPPGNDHQRPDPPPDDWRRDNEEPVYPPTFDWNPWREENQGNEICSETSCTNGFRDGNVVQLGNTTTTALPKEEKEPLVSDKKWNPSDIRPGAEAVPKSLGSIDFFIVMADPQGQYLATLNNEDLSADTAQNYITSVLNTGTETGTLNNFQFYQLPKENGTLMVFTDKRAELDMLGKLMRTTIIIGTAAFLILSVAAYFLSRQVMKPLKTAFEKQKQFVSDASHELKTPVTVISANADVLADEIGENKWLTYIKSQTERMNILVNDLLNLTRLENNTVAFVKSDFDLSKAIVNTALPFECQAFETNKKFELDIEEGISLSGSERHIKQMTAIFIDNALKYSNDGGIVRVTLKKSGDKRYLSIYNTGTGVKDSEKDKIFERFYRSDESRNRATGGYGLGLAIAKSIIDRHKFKVSVENNEGKSICFIITM